MNLTMSEDQFSALSAKLDATVKSIPRVLAIAKFMMLACFAVGAWVAVVDYRQGHAEEVLRDLKGSTESAELRLRNIENRSASNEAKLDAIKETVQRIDRKIDMP